LAINALHTYRLTAAQSNGKITEKSPYPQIPLSGTPVPEDDGEAERIMEGY